MKFKLHMSEAATISFIVYDHQIAEVFARAFCMHEYSSYILVGGSSLTIPRNR